MRSMSLSFITFFIAWGLHSASASDPDLNEKNSQLSRISAKICGNKNTKFPQVSPARDHGKKSTRNFFDGGSDNLFGGIAKLKIVYEYNDRVELDHCGGTIIHPRYVLTASHCINPNKNIEEAWNRIEIESGDSELGGSNSFYRTSNTAICHAGFEYENLSFDIALIRLDEPIPLEFLPMKIDEFLQPSIHSGSYVIAAGWPVMGRHAGSKTLKKYPLKVVDLNWPGFIAVKSLFDTVDGLCNGESGAPVISISDGTTRLVGVLSGVQAGDLRGEPCQQRGYEMYFTPLAAYRNWIDQVISFCESRPDDYC